MIYGAAAPFLFPHTGGRYPFARKKKSGLRSDDLRPLEVSFLLFPLFFGNLLRLIYALYYILKGNFDTDFLPVILFIKIFVAEKVAKSPAGWCWVVVG